jgi:hypothetical protein
VERALPRRGKSEKISRSSKNYVKEPKIYKQNNLYKYKYTQGNSHSSRFTNVTKT